VIGPRVGVVGAGDTAMDCARSALRAGATSVALIYRRTVDEMPADPEEIHAVREEGIEIVELARPIGLRVEDEALAGVVCGRTAYRGERDAGGRKVPVDVPDSTFEIGLDTLILAISQHPVLDLFGDRPPELTAGGFIAVDPATLETSIPGVYAGGDVAGSGPASIVKAAADGKRAAAAIAARLGIEGSRATGHVAPVDLSALVIRRARREYRVPIQVSPLNHRDGFEETVLGYTAEEARREASRCLDCDMICSLCVGVCPNMALMTYETAPVSAALPELAVVGGAAVVTGSTPFVVDQRLQIAVLTDVCNECGNCVTVCPTSGRPYVDKPRLYLDRTDFEAQSANAFMLLGSGVIEGRFDGATHRLSANGRLAYTAPGLRAVLDRDTFAMVEATPTGAAEGETMSLEPAAVMATLLAGVTGSLPHIPAAADGGTRVVHPRYAE
jgi:putative selenate reductase